MIDKGLYKLNEDDKKMDQAFVDSILLRIYISHCLAMELPIEINADSENGINLNNIKNKIHEIEKSEGSIEAIVNSTIYKASYNPEKQNYLDIASEIVNRLANKHTLDDGNKRTALFTGLLIVSTDNNIKLKIGNSIKSYTDDIINVVKRWQEDVPEEEQLNDICNFLDSFVVKE